MPGLFAGDGPRRLRQVLMGKQRLASSRRYRRLEGLAMTMGGFEIGSRQSVEKLAIQRPASRGFVCIARFAGLAKDGGKAVERCSEARQWTQPEGIVTHAGFDLPPVSGRSIP